MRFLLDTADDDHRLAEVGLGMPRRMRQRHEHLAASSLALPHIILHDRIAAGKAMLVLEPLEHPLRRVALLAVDLAITLQPQPSMIPVKASSFGRFTAAFRR